MRTLTYALLSLTLAVAAFGQDAPAKKSGDGKAEAEGTLSTPFGVAKTTKSATVQPKPKKVRPDWKVEKDADDFKFTKKTPFGPSSWTRTEAELTADERAVAEHNGLLQPVEEPAEEEGQTAAKQP